MDADVQKLLISAGEISNGVTRSLRYNTLNLTIDDMKALENTLKLLAKIVRMARKMEETRRGEYINRS